MILSLALPAILLIAAAILVPRGLEPVVPESLGGLVLLGVLSAMALWALSGLGFALLYHLRGATFALLAGENAAPAFRHFAALGLKAALIWLPVLVLAVSTAPRRWKTATW